MFIIIIVIIVKYAMIRWWVQTFPASHTKAAPNGKFCEGYIAPSTVMFMYQYQYALK